MMWRDALYGLGALFFPRRCVVCGALLLPQERVVCLACSMDLPYTMLWSEADNPVAQIFYGRFPFYRAASLCYYSEQGALRSLMHVFKYRGRRDVGRFFASRLAARLRGTELGAAVRVVVPVPMHPLKRWFRGFNPAERVARELARDLGAVCCPGLLRRSRLRRSQTLQDRTSRAQSVVDMYHAPKARLRGARIHGIPRQVLEAALATPGAVLIVDDVITTGATLEACAQALQARYPQCVPSLASVAYVE